MRIIKFRAWDKWKKKFIPTDVWAITPEPIGREQAVMIKDWEDYKEGESFYPENEALMQFTGLLDKNGREIYEGDIVETPKGIKYGVFWSPTKTKFALKTANVWTIYLAGAQRQWIYRAMESATKFEVIGSIYENPELLNQKEI